MGKLVALLIIACFMLLILGLFGLFGMFVLRLWNDHLLADKYRELLKEAEANRQNPVTTSTGPSWTIGYKLGRKTHTIVVPGVDEGAAYIAFTKLGIRYDNITSLTKN